MAAPTDRQTFRHLVAEIAAKAKKSCPRPSTGESRALSSWCWPGMFSSRQTARSKSVVLRTR